VRSEADFQLTSAEALFQLKVGTGSHQTLTAVYGQDAAAAGKEGGEGRGGGEEEAQGGECDLGKPSSGLIV
jgi:hypothetical protein